MRQLKTTVTSVAAILTIAAPAYALPFNDLEREGRYAPYEFNMDDGGVPQFPVYTVVTNNDETYCLTSTYEDAGETFYLDRVFLLPYTHGPNWQGAGRAVCRSKETRELTSQEFGDEFNEFLQYEYDQLIGRYETDATQSTPGMLSVPCVNGGGSGGWMYENLPDEYFPLGLISANQWPLRSVPDHPMYDPDSPWDKYATCVIVPANQS
jgi:hypothetical protein